MKTNTKNLQFGEFYKIKQHSFFYEVQWDKKEDSENKIVLLLDYNEVCNKTFILISVRLFKNKKLGSLEMAQLLYNNKFYYVNLKDVYPVNNNQ